MWPKVAPFLLTATGKLDVAIGSTIRKISACQKSYGLRFLSLPAAFPLSQCIHRCPRPPVATVERLTLESGHARYRVACELSRNYETRRSGTMISPAPST